MTTMYGLWEVYPGNDLSTLALPDYYSTYLSYTLRMSRHPGTGLRVTGNFPDARYMSFNIYASRSGESLNALTDYQIRTLDPNANPFVAGSKAPPDGQYVVNVQPKPESDSSDSDAVENLLSFDPADLEPEGLLTVIIRYYVPKGEYGGVRPPAIELYHLSDNSAVHPQPEPYPTHMDLNKPIFRHRLDPIFETASGDTLRFYHAGGGGQFNNADNIYLISAVKNVDGHNNVVILKVKPPTYPCTNDEFDKTIVRYWSFNQGNPDTSTPWGMKDEEFQTAKDGYVYILMADDSFRSKASQAGYNFMLWKADKERAVILYRNMLTIPQYRGSIARVPELPPSSTWNETVFIGDEASQYIGDYAPVGRKVSAQEFNSSCGGMASPGFA